MDDSTRISPRSLVDRFRSARTDKPRLTVEEFLADEHDPKTEVLQALIAVDVQAQVSSGREVDLVSYARRWPDLDPVWLNGLARSDTAGKKHANLEPSPPPAGVDGGAIAPEPGQRIEHYEILELLGSGTHGKVYAARDLELERIVALKLSRDCGMEGRILAHLSHPNIVEVFRQFQFGSQLCLAMQLVDGPTLRDFLATQPFASPAKWDRQRFCQWVSERRHGDSADGDCNAQQPRSSYMQVAVDIVAGVARALNHAHQRGVLHRDVKPSNVLLDAAGCPMLTDFNVAILDSAQDQGRFGGTIAYMSPEHLAALDGDSEGEVIDVRSDIYSLGILFLELLIGRRTWCDSESVLAQRCAGPSQSVLEAVHWRLRPIISRCLRPAPDERYQSTAEMLSDLEAWASNAPLIHARHTNWIGKTRSWAHAYQRKLFLTVFLAVCSLLIYGIALYRSSSITDRCQSLSLRAEESLQKNDVARALEYLGEAKGLIATVPLTRWLRYSTVREIDSRWNEILVQAKSLRLQNHLNAIRNLTKARTERGKSPSAFALESLSEFGLLDDDDWELHPPFATLDAAGQQRVSEQLTELILLLALQREHMNQQQKEQFQELWNRVPTKHANSAALQLVANPNDLHSVAGLDEFQNYLVGIVKFHQEEYAVARSHFARSRTTPRNSFTSPRYWCTYWEAFCCQELDRDEEAVALYGACFGMQPNFPWPYFNLALLHARDERLELALEYLNHAVRLDPRFERAQTSRVAVLVRLGQYDLALQAIVEAEELGLESQEWTQYQTICHQNLNRN